MILPISAPCIARLFITARCINFACSLLPHFMG